jgi:prepilin-type N-terminal cleavage/methylation domain-containing protein
MFGLQQKNGYSLPELLITILLLSILFSLAIIFSSGMSQNRRLRDYSIAVAFAQQAVEIVRAAPYSLLDEVDAGENSVETDLNSNSGPQDHFESEFKSGGITYIRKVKIEDVMAKEDKERPIGLKLLTVRVDWKTLEGAEVEPFILKTTIADLN